MTEIVTTTDQGIVISTHTLTWSVTSKCGKRDSVCRHFNSHAHVERDQNGYDLPENISISTHTLTWSVT